MEKGIKVRYNKEPWNVKYTLVKTINIVCMAAFKCQNMRFKNFEKCMYTGKMFDLYGMDLYWK
jgi:hypothetical protein